MKNERLISVDALMRKICGAKCGCEYEDCGREGDCIFDYFFSNAPSVDAVQVVHGRWIDMQEDEVTDGMWRCSVCGSDRYFDITTPEECGCHYCPNCGAKMDGERKDNG